METDSALYEILLHTFTTTQPLSRSLHRLRLEIYLFRFIDAWTLKR